MFIADSHCDTLYSIAIHGQRDDELMASKQRLKDGGVCLQTYALYTGSHREGSSAYSDAIKMIEASKTIGVPFFNAKLPLNPPSELHGIYSIEGGEALEGSINRLYELNNSIRIRMIALTWNYENEIGFPAKSGSPNGLKPFGIELLKEMDKLGIYADVSHLNEAGFWDIYENMTLPPIASHSNFRDICDVPRNLNKTQIEAIIEKHGYIGINFYPYFVNKTDSCTIDDLIRHIDAIADMGGIDVLGLGSDFDGIECQPKDLENAAKFPNLVNALLRHGYTEEQTAGIAGKNLWRILKYAEKE